jgi:diguanylate cyclase
MGDNVTVDQLNKTFETLRLAVPLMIQYGIPATGENYWVWYRYVSGQDNQLKQTIEKMIEEKEEFTKEKNDALFTQFCQHHDEGELQKIREDLKKVLESLFKQTQELTGQAEEYDTFVSSSIAGLKEISTVQEIRNVVDQITTRTKTLAKFGKAMRFRLEASLEALSTTKKDFEQVKVEASLDFLTGVPNRKSFFETLAVCCQDASHCHENLSLLFVDVDHFKKFNDQFGHLLGDEVLKFVASKIQNSIRKTDFVGRFGGEEFAVIMPHTSIEAAQMTAERIRSRFAQSPLKTSGSSRQLGVITVSVGVALYRWDELAEDFVNRADQALYLAKSNGRNCVATDALDLARTG